MLNYLHLSKENDFKEGSRWVKMVCIMHTLHWRQRDVIGKWAPTFSFPYWRFCDFDLLIQPFNCNENRSAFGAVVLLYLRGKTPCPGPASTAQAHNNKAGMIGYKPSNVTRLHRGSLFHTDNQPKLTKHFKRNMEETLGGTLEWRISSCRWRLLSMNKPAVDYMSLT